MSVKGGLNRAFRIAGILVVLVLAVLAAGGCYLPLDPAYPRERLLAMLEDGGARWLLTERSLAELLPGSIGPERLFLSPDGELLGAAGERPASQSGGAWLCRHDRKALSA